MVRRTFTQTATLLSEIWAGMPVFDASGNLVGTVKCVEESRDRLKLTGAALMDNDCLVRVDQIASADEERVVLAVTAAALSTEYGRWI